MTEKYFGSYTFDMGTGYSTFTVWEGPKMFRAVVFNETDAGYQRREIRDRDPQKLFIRMMAIIQGASGTKLVLVEEDGEPFPWRVRTEEDEVREFARDFLRTMHGRELIKNIAFGPEHKLGPEYENGGENGY